MKNVIFLYLFIILNNAYTQTKGDYPYVTEGDSIIDSFLYDEIQINDTNFIEAFSVFKNVIVDSLKCYDYEYVRVLYNDSSKYIGFVPISSLTNLIFDYSWFSDSNHEPFYLFKLDGIFFQFNKIDLKKMKLNYCVEGFDKLFKSSDYQENNSNECNLKGFKPVFIFKINNGLLIDAKIRIIKNSVFGITRLDLK